MENKNFAFGGITRSIGSAVCADGDLHTAVDVCNDGVGLQLLEKPRELFKLADGETLLCVHEPEGEGRHYITQLVVTSGSNVQPAPALRDGGQEPSDSGNGQIEESEPLEPFVPVDPYIDPSQDTPPDIDENEDFNDEVPYIPSDYVDYPTIPTSNYASAEQDEEGRDDDDGGDSVTPSGSSTIDPPSTSGVYLMWRDGDGTLKQYIDITAYGRVTAVQPMGNTLVCNHEGVTSPEQVLPEIRYYIFKTEEGEYIPLGSKPPFVNITFGLESTFEYWPKTESTFDSDSTPTKYKKYGGITISSYPYTDTVGVYWDKNAPANVTPYDTYADNDSILGHWSGTYSIADVTSPDGKTDVAGMKVNWTTMALGCYNKFIAEQNKAQKFVFPFYARYAIELYDGSLIMHSYPVLMIPNSRGPIFGLDGIEGLAADLDDEGQSYEKVRITFRGRTYGFASTLMHQIKALSANEHARLENWRDLIKGINIYVTPPIYNYNQGGQVLGWHSMSDLDPANNDKDPWQQHYTQGKVTYGTGLTKTGDTTMEEAFRIMLNDRKIFWRYSTRDIHKSPPYCLTIPQKEEKEIIELHENAGQFYKLASIDFDDLLTYTASGMSDAAVLRDNKNKNLLATIANQDIMQDDNHSHDKMSAEVLYGYNRRLNMAKVSKVLHSPLPMHTQLPTDYTTGHQYHEILHVKNEGTTAELRTTSTTANVDWPKFLFYPNTDATEAYIIHNSARYKIKLKEHKALNGMFWLSDFLNNYADLQNHLLNGSAASSVTISTTESNKDVDESNKIYTSETDNPFVVPFGNINIAGGGEVQALAAATTAMSQGQFGQFPMYTFTSEGVWAMTVSDTGGWATIQPVTRDVITEGTMPLSLDSTVVFLGDRGLLQLGGTETTPLSGAVRSYDSAVFSKVLQLSEATGTDDLLAAANSLLAFPDVAVLTYDARSGRIYVTPENVEASWVYNLKSGLWTQATTHIDHQVTTYPECEGQQGNMIVEIGGELGYQKDKGLVITRSVKFGGGAVLRRIHEMAVRGQFKPYSGTVKTALWGTRDWINNALVASSQNNRITRWGGSPYFGHSIGLFITQPADYLLHAVGVDASIDVEHFNKLR